METIVDIMSAMPGERFVFRIIGRPKSWYRHFLSDGSYIDSDNAVKGVESTKVFSVFAIDRYSGRMCVVLMPGDLAKMLSKRFRVANVSPGSENGVDVDISILQGDIRYLIDIGKVSTADSDMIEKTESLWDSVKDEIVNHGEKEDVLSMASRVVSFRYPTWGDLIDTSVIDDVLDALDNEEYQKVLKSFLVKATDGNDEISKEASSILRMMRILASNKD